MHATTIHLEPVAKPSPRVGKRGTYWPNGYRTWCLRCKSALATWWRDREPLDGPLVLEIVAVRARPQRFKAKRHPDGRIRHDKKPDADNISKAVCDALSSVGVIWDDARITRLVVEKFYAGRGEEPCIEIRVGKLEEERDGRGE